MAALWDMSDFRFQPWPGTIAITTLLEFCSWLEIINKEVILADHRKIKEVLYNEKDLLSILDTAYDFSSICACECCKQ